VRIACISSGYPTTRGSEPRSAETKPRVYRKRLWNATKADSRRIDQRHYLTADALQLHDLTSNVSVGLPGDRGNGAGDAWGMSRQADTPVRTILVAPVPAVPGLSLSKAVLGRVSGRLCPARRWASAAAVFGAVECSPWLCAGGGMHR
jgi:hypothetical protein